LRSRPAIEFLENRILLDGNPVPLLAQHLLFSLGPSAPDWKQAGTVWSTPGEVVISTTDAPNQSLLLIENGVAIDTSTLSPSFKLPATPNKPNYLDYYPSSIDKLARLWQFTADYTFNKLSGLNNLVQTDPTAKPQLVTVAGPSVSGIDSDEGLKIANLGGGSTLVPSALYITPANPTTQTPLAVNLSGLVDLNGIGSKLAKFLDHLHVGIGDDATYVVRAGADGLVQLVSKSGSGIWLDVTTESKDQTGTFGSVKIHWVTAALSWNQQTKELSFAGQWAISLKDDSTDQTPFLVSLGDPGNSSHLGLTLNCASGTIEHFQAAFSAGTDGGKYRGSFHPAGTTITVVGLLFMYDAQQDQIGVGGQATMGFGAKDDKGQYANNLTVTLGNVSADRAGLFIQDGVVHTFTGRFILKEDPMKVGLLPFTGDITVAYQAQDKDHPVSFVSIAGTLSLGLPGGFSVGVIIPPDKQGQGLIIKGNGDWDVAGGIGFSINGSFGIDGLGFSFDQLAVVYTRPPNSQGGVDHVWTVSGGVTLTTLWKTSITLGTAASPGLKIVNGSWEIDAIRLDISGVNLGDVFQIKHAVVDYQKTSDGKGYQIQASGQVVVATLFEVDFNLDFDNGRPRTLGVDFSAAGEEPGIPVADTGLFITEIGFQVSNLDDAKELVVSGSIGVGFGEGIQFEGHTVRLLSARGQFKADRHEFDLSGDFSVMDGLIATGSGSITLNWSLHQYHAKLDVLGFDGVIEVRGEFDLNEFNQITLYAAVSVHVPNGIPFIGGLTLASLDGLFYWDPVNKANSLVAGWVDIDLYFFHIRGGLEYDFYPAPSQPHLHWIGSGAVEHLEQVATSHPDGYHATFDEQVGGSGSPPSQALFTYEWDTPNEVGDVTITVPDGQKVIIRKGTTDAVKFTSGGVAYVARPVAALIGANRYAWAIAPDASQNPDNAFLPIPVGKYHIDILAAEPGSLAFTTGQAPHTKLTVGLSYPPPQITKVTLSQAAYTNNVTVQVGYKTALPSQTTIDLFYTTDPGGTTGTKFASVPVTTGDKFGTVTVPWDITDLTWKQNYHVFARISDGQNSNGKRPAISATTVSPLVDLSIRLAIAPPVPVDVQADTLTGWPVIWQELDANGKPVGDPVYGATDSSGEAAINRGAGKTWRVTVAPANRDGFIPLKDDPGQDTTTDGNLIIKKVTGTGYASPTQVVANFQNMISVHGQVSLDLGGQAQYEPGGAGLAGRLVYVDLNNNGQKDPGEPATMTDLGGYYDLRFPLPDPLPALPTVITTYTVRLLPQDEVKTWVRKDPDSVVDFSFVVGASYQVTVDPHQTHPREFFDHRDLLLDEPIIISGVAYRSGPTGNPYGVGSVPAPGELIDLWDMSGAEPKLVDTTNSDLSDGSYHFVVPKTGPYKVSTDINDASQVAVPGRIQFQTDPDPSHLDFQVPVKTPSGGQLYQLGSAGTAPLVATGDFFGNGASDTATLAVDSPTWSAASPAGLYLVIYKGADLPSHVTGQAVLIAANVPPDSGRVPSVFWNGDLGLFILPTPQPVGGVLGYTYDPVAQKVATIGMPAVPAGMTKLMAVSADKATGSLVYLLSSDTGNQWALVEASGGTPTVVAAFSFLTAAGFAPSNGIRPDVLQSAGPGTAQAGRWAALVTGDFDGDGIPDYAFSGADSTGNPIVGYLLSKENYQAVHALLLGGGAPGTGPNAWIASVNAIQMSKTINGPSGLPYLAVHRSSLTGPGPNAAPVNQMLLFAPVPASDSQVVAGAPPVSFAFQSNFPLQGGFSDDVVRDVNNDGYPDLLVLDDQVLGVLLNQGNGTLAAPVYSRVQGYLNPGAVGGLLTTSDFSSHGCNCGDLPSFLYLQQSQDGKPLALQLVANTSVFDNSYLFEVQSPGSYGGYNFGFTRSPSPIVSGGLFAGGGFVDSNGNGRQDPGEPNLTGLAIQVGSGDTVATDLYGRFQVPGSGLPVVISAPGVRPTNTAPANRDASYTLPAASGAQTGYDFGIRYAVNPAGAVQGIIFIDSSGTGQWTPNDSPAPGITVFLDENGDGTLGPGDPQTTTDAHGAYRFDGLTPGHYVVVQVLPPGWKQVSTTQPAKGVDVEPRQTTYGINFGDSKPVLGQPGPPPPANNQFVQALYRDLLGRGGDSAGVAFWVSVLQGGGSRAQVVSGLWNSPEHRGLQVDQLYATYLHRAADPPGRAFWVAALEGGMSETDVARGLLTSAEYQRAHADPAVFVLGLYQDALGRAPGDAELAGWLAAPPGGLSRDAMAQAFLGSAENQGRLVDGYYAAALGRPADPAGREFFVTLLQSRQLSTDQVAAEMFASDEYLARALGGAP
jgi:hypothetical protein